MTEAFKATGLHHAMYIIPILALAAAVVLFAASRTMDKDVRKQEFAQPSRLGDPAPRSCYSPRPRSVSLKLAR